MKIHAYNYSDVFGGQERYIESLLQALRARNIQCSFIGSPARLAAHNQQCTAEISNQLSVELLNGNRALYLRSWRKRRSHLRVYVQHSNVLDGQQHRIKLWIRKILLRLLLTRMDVVIRVCQQSLPNRYAPGKIYTIYNGVNLPPLPQQKAAHQAFTLLMVGAINENKNQLLALEMLERLPDIQLILVGNGPRMLEWQAWATQKGLASRVQWKGFVDATEQYYQQADALLMLSRFEAFPYAVIEAMSFAVPVIAAPVGGIPEAITHEKDGILLPVCDLEHLCNAVQQLKDRSEWRKQMGVQARQTISERFTLHKVVDDLLAVIGTAAQKKGFDL